MFQKHTFPKTFHSPQTSNLFQPKHTNQKCDHLSKNRILYTPFKQKSKTSSLISKFNELFNLKTKLSNTLHYSPPQ